MDVMTPDQRHRAMAHNRGRTRPETTLATALWRRGFRYLTSDGFKQRYGRALPGHPDLIFPRLRVAVFVDGCFWHGCPECKRLPENSTPYWLNKIRTNVERDRRINDLLASEGWRVVRIPEHAVRTKARLEATTLAIARLLREIGGHTCFGQVPEVL